MTDEFWPVALRRAPPDFRIGEQNIAFHGINKSGSGAFANVVHAAFFNAGRANRIFSNYHGCPNSLERLLDIVRCSEASQRLLFIGHYLYGASALRDRPPAYMTIFRHPLPRIISCHSWMTRRHMAAGKAGSYPTLEAFVKRSQGKSHTQIAQFGVGFGDRRHEVFKKKSVKDIYEDCVRNVETDVAWFGVAEMFEESIFMFAHLFDLPRIPPWKKDTRNPDRTSAFDLPRDLRALIEREYEYEFLFYEEVVKKFKALVDKCDFGDELREYKAECAGEYKDRILA